MIDPDGAAYDKYVISLLICVVHYILSSRLAFRRYLNYGRTLSSSGIPSRRHRNQQRYYGDFLQIFNIKREISMTVDKPQVGLDM